MSIIAKVEVQKGEFLPINLRGSGSKAIATFITPLSDYCHRSDGRKASGEVVKWFSNLEASMIERLCLLEHTTYGSWNYSEGEYDRYANDMRIAHDQTVTQNPPISRRLVGRRGYEEYLQKVTSGNIEIMSKEEFIQTCQQIEQKWVDTSKLQRVIEDLIRVLEEFQPEDVWWYNKEVSLPDFKMLSQTLSVALKEGFQRVRIYLS